MLITVEYKVSLVKLVGLLKIPRISECKCVFILKSKVCGNFIGNMYVSIHDEIELFSLAVYKMYSEEEDLIKHATDKVCLYV